MLGSLDIFRQYVVPNYNLLMNQYHTHSIRRRTLEVPGSILNPETGCAV
jgi:hypothetical protein